MLELAERAYFRFCLALGGLLRASRYSSARIVDRDGKAHVRKHRRFYAPLLVWLGDPLVVMLDTGVRVLHRAEWEERERQMYSRLYGLSIRVESGGVLLLPHLVGVTLASLLEDPLLDDSVRSVAIERAVVALARLHRAGFTHGDAMAENVLLDLEAGVARWFDFETVHDLGRPIAWRRADDVRALLATCVVRTEPQRIPETFAVSEVMVSPKPVHMMMGMSGRMARISRAIASPVMPGIMWSVMMALQRSGSARKTASAAAAFDMVSQR